MTDRNDNESALERTLRERFGEMRREDRLAAPPVPDITAVAAAEPPVRRGRVPATAAALVAGVALAVVLLPERQEPDTLYLEIMNASALMTDQLLDVSPAALPGVSDLPLLYETDMSAGSLPRTN